MDGVDAEGEMDGVDVEGERVLSDIRRRHEMKSAQALPAKSTVGIVLEGTMVNIIVPGSPSYRENAQGQRIEPGDQVTAIDGVDVTKADIISKLRGPDLPGSPVTISVLKKNMTESVDFKLVRADMRSVMNLKDLYLALGELHTEMDNPRPERLKSKVESLEKRVQAVTHFNEEQGNHHQAHIKDLEQSVRDLYAHKGNSDALAKVNTDLEALKTQHMALLEECDTLKQKLKAASKDAQQGAQKLGATSMVNLFKGAVAATKQRDTELRADSAEGDAAEAKKNAQLAREELQRAQNEALKIREDSERMRLAAGKELEQAREESERLRSEAARLQDAAGSASSRADGTDKQLQKVKAECEDLRKQASELRIGAGSANTRADNAESRLAQVERELKPARDKLMQAAKELEEARGHEERLQSQLQESERQLQERQKECNDLERKLQEIQVDAEASHLGGQKALQAVKEEVERLQSSCDKLGSELKSVRESEKLTKAQLESSQQNLDRSRREVGDVKIQLEPLQATEKSLIAQLSTEKSKVQELQRKVSDLDAACVRLKKDSTAAEAKSTEMKVVAEQRTQEAKESQASVKSLQRQVEQAQVQIKRLESELQGAERGKEDGTARVAGALAECEKLREELRGKDAELSRLEFACDQAKDRASTVKEQLQAVSEQALTTQKELEGNRKEMRLISEEGARCRIQVEELERSLANKDTQISAQIQVLRSEKEDLYKQSHSLLEERRLARSELLKQKTELETYRNFSSATREAVCDDKVDVRGERRMMMLQKALEKSECDRASLEKQLRELQGVGIPRAAASAPGERDLAAPMGSLPVFNTRTDDIGVVALAALGCLIMSGGIMYLQRSLGGGGVGGAFVVMCGLVGFVLSVVVLFKIFLYLFGANSDEVLTGRIGYLPINSEPADDRLRKVSPDAPRFPTLDSIPRPDPATLAFLTTGQQYVAAASQHPYQTQDVRPSPGRSRPERSLSPKGQGIAGWEGLDSQRSTARVQSNRSRGSRPLDFV